MLSIVLLALLAGWTGRLALPRLFQADLDLHVAARELNVSGYDTGFPDDPEERLAAAQARLGEGSPAARDLHQAASALAALHKSELLQKALPVCLRAYQRELEQHPTDLDRHLDAADAFALAGGLSRDDRFYRDALALLERAAALAPEDARVPDLAADVGARRALAHGRGPAGLADLEAAEVHARRALELAPREPRSSWRLFHVRHLRTAVGPTDPQAFVRLAALADELGAAARAAEGGERMELAAEGYWFLASLPAYMARVRGGASVDAPAADAAVVARLAAFRPRLEELPPGTLGPKLARAWWMLTVFAAPVEGWPEDLARAVRGGVAEVEAAALALVAFHGRGEAAAAARVAELLVERTAGAPVESADRALAVYLHEIGDDRSALERVARWPRADPPLRLARAVLELRLARTDGVAGRLALLAAETSGGPLAGEVQHALGVAYALAGDERALEALARAIEGAPEDAPARATLEELRALRGWAGRP